MDEHITRREHEEFVKRMDEANERQSKRISILETDIRQIGELTAAVKELAASMKGMSSEQEKQGKRLETLEKRDGDKWRKVVETVITVVVSAVVGFALAHIGM